MPLREIRVSLWRRNWFWALVLIAFVFIAYSQVFRAGFIWDDESHLTRNPCVVGPLGLKEIWTSTQAVYYPLVLTTFWILHNVAGLNPLQYRLLNVCYMPPLQLCFGAFCDYSKFAEHGWALLYGALHPVMVQSVAWVTELKNTQSGFPYLSSIFCFLKSDKETADYADNTDGSEQNSPDELTKSLFPPT